jgi:hypothetical protein
VVFANGPRQAQFSGTVRVVSFGSEQYQWKNDELNSHADPDGPPVAADVDAKASGSFELPKASVTILRGKVSGLER